MQDGVELQDRDFFQERFSESELRSLIGDRSPSDYFSWKSPSFKKLGLNKEQMDDDRLIQMMAEEPRLIRRPLIQVGNNLLVGTDKPAMQLAFPEVSR